MAAADDAGQPTSGAGDSVSTGSDVLLPIAGNGSSASDVANWIDMYRDGLRIFFCSAGFTLNWAAPSIGLKRLPMTIEPKDFTKWLQVVVQSRIPTSCRRSMRPPRLWVARGFNRRLRGFSTKPVAVQCDPPAYGWQEASTSGKAPPGASE
jgi:hypothetical protein